MMDFRGFGVVVIFSVFLTHPPHAVCACADRHPQESYAPGLLYAFPTLPTRVLFAATTAAVKPVLNWANCSPNILRTVGRTIIPFLTELLFRRIWFGQFDELCFVLNWLIMRCKLRPELATEAQQTA